MTGRPWFAGTLRPHQPPQVFANPSDMYVESDGSWAVVHGLISNADELCAEVSAPDATDAALVLALHRSYGADCVHRLRGNFAFAVWRNGQLLLARDRFGVQPLYWADDRQGITFASSPAGLFHHGVTPVLDRTALADLTVHGRLLGEASGFEGVRALRAGQLLNATNQSDSMSCAASQYYQLPQEDTLEHTELAEAGEQLLMLLRTNLMPDEGSALLLSGGLDSAVLAALAAPDAGWPMWTAFERDDHPDAIHAQRVANATGGRASQLTLRFEDFLAAIPDYVGAVGHPSGLGSVGLALLCRSLATAGFRRGVTGEGTDDVFGGYTEYITTMRNHHATLARASELARRGFPLSDEGTALLTRFTLNIGYPNYLQMMHADQELSPTAQRDAQIAAVVAERAGIRLHMPYLDHRFVEFVFSLPLELRADYRIGMDKRLLRLAVLQSFGGREALVDSVLRRKFALPSSVWAHTTKFTSLCRNVLTPDQVADHQYAPLADSAHQLLLLDLFEEIFVRYLGMPPAEFTMTGFLRQRSRDHSPVAG